MTISIHGIKGVEGTQRGFQGKSSDGVGHASGLREPRGEHLVQVRWRAGRDTWVQSLGQELSRASPEATHLLHHVCGFPESRWIPCSPFFVDDFFWERWEDGNVPERCVGKVGSQSGRGPLDEGLWVCRLRELDLAMSHGGSEPWQHLFRAHWWVRG